MLVEINLLPQKEPRKLSFIILFASLLFMILLVGGYYFFQIYSTKLQLESVDSQIVSTKKIAEHQNNQSFSVEASNSVSQLKSAVEWANSYPIQTIPVIRHLTALLPERGFIQSFAYTDSGTVSISVQFDTATDAAYFLDSLNGSEWIAEASLSSLNTTSDTADSSDAATTTNSQSNSTSTNTSSESNQSTVGNTANQNASGVSTNNATNLNNGTAASISSKSEEKNDQYLPRYLGQFEITLNKATIKDVMKQSQADDFSKNGGTSS